MRAGKKHYFSAFLSFVFLVFFSLLFSTLDTQSAYAQCKALCTHERGDTSAGTNGSFFEQSYEVALDDGDSAEADSAGEDLLLAADDTGTDTVSLDAPSKEWHFSITPYGWFMGLNGKVGVGGQTIDLDVSFSDIVQNLDFAAELHMEAWRDRFGFFVDGTYSKISLKKDAQLRFDRSIKVKNVTEFFLGEFGGFYRVGTWPVGSVTGSNGSKAKKFFTLDILGGGRYWWMKNKIDITGPAGILDPDFSASKNWFDFIVGGRARFDINKFFVALRTDIGGFGLEFSSDISWNIAGYLGYELPWYHITPIIGYRALYDKYSDGSGNNRFLWDAWMLGPQLGVAFQF
jgi:hypothetical protein